MELPIKYNDVKKFIESNNLFEVTKKHLFEWLENSYQENATDFENSLNANLEVVLKSYIFKDEGVSFNQSFSYEPPMNYITVRIRIHDDNDSYLNEYTAFFDLDLKIFDDVMK